MMRSSRRGISSTASNGRGPIPKRQSSTNTRLARGVLKRPTNFWRATAERGDGCDPVLLMSAKAATFSIGMPVEIGKIERELKKLWAEGGESMTRASLINLAVYSEEPDSLPRNTQIVAEVTEDHACRAIVIAIDPAGKESRIEAWIAAHCHVSRAGTKQVC